MEKLIEFFNKVVFYRFFVSIGIGLLAFYFILVPFLNLAIYQDKYKKLPQSIIDLYDLSNIGVDYNFLTVFVFLVITFIVGEIISIAGESLLLALFDIRFSYIFDKIPEKFREFLGLKVNEGNDKYDFGYVDPFLSNEKLGYNQICQGRESFCFEMSEIFFSLSRAFMAVWLVSVIGFISFALIQNELINKSANLSNIGDQVQNQNSLNKNEGYQQDNPNKDKVNPEQSHDLEIKIFSNFVLTLFIFTIVLAVLLSISKFLSYLYAITLAVVFFKNLIVLLLIVVILSIKIKEIKEIIKIIIFFPSLFPAIIIPAVVISIIVLTLKYMKNGGYVDFVFTIIFAMFIQYTLFAAIHYRRHANIILQWLYENELKKEIIK